MSEIEILKDRIESLQAALVAKEETHKIEICKLIYKERNMDEDRFDQLYNRILDGENWDYSTLDELIGLSESGAREKARQEIKKKAIEAYKKACTCIGCNHCDDCDSVREFIQFLNS